MSNLLHTVNIEDTKQKLYERLKPSGWGDKLKTFIMSSDFDKILISLLKEAQNGKRFTPVLKQVFRAFEECPYNELKAVMIAQDPYPYNGVADGIAFSCANTMKPEASLNYIFKEIQDTVYPLTTYDYDPDLKRWSNQGILLINLSFTTEIGKVDVHTKIWEPFITFLLDCLEINNNGLIYVFLGKKAGELTDYVSENNHKINVTHPASAAFLNLESWNSENLFNRISDLMHNYYKYKMIW